MKKKKWNLGNLKQKISNCLPNYQSLALQALKTSLILKVEFTYISGDQYEKQAYGILTNVLRRILEDLLIQQEDEEERRPIHTHK